MRVPLWLLIVTTVLAWASAFVAIKECLPAFGPLGLSLARLGAASLALFAVALWKRPRRPERRDWGTFALMGLLGFALYNLCLNMGERSVPAGTAAFIVQTAPLWTTLLAVGLLREHVTPRGWLGIVLSLCGVGLLALSRADSGASSARGALLIFGAAIGISGYVIAQKRLLPRYGAWSTTVWATWCGLVWLLPFLPLAWPQLRAASPESWLWVLYLGAIPSALAFVTWGAVLERFPASRAVSFLYGVPFCAALLGFALLHEPLSPLAMSGGVLAMAGVALVNAKRSDPAAEAAGNDTKPACAG